MAICCVPFCKTTTKNKPPGVQLHRFPVDEKECNRWLKLIRRENYEWSMGSFICSLHFPNGKAGGPTKFPWNENKSFELNDLTYTLDRKRKVVSKTVLQQNKNPSKPKAKAHVKSRKLLARRKVLKIETPRLQPQLRKRICFICGGPCTSIPTQFRSIEQESYFKSWLSSMSLTFCQIFDLIDERGNGEGKNYLDLIVNQFQKCSSCESLFRDLDFNVKLLVSLQRKVLDLYNQIGTLAQTGSPKIRQLLQESNSSRSENSLVGTGELEPEDIDKFFQELLEKSSLPFDFNNYYYKTLNFKSENDYDTNSSYKDQESMETEINMCDLVPKTEEELTDFEHENEAVEIDNSRSPAPILHPDNEINEEEIDDDIPEPPYYDKDYEPPKWFVNKSMARSRKQKLGAESEFLRSKKLKPTSPASETRTLQSITITPILTETISELPQSRPSASELLPSSQESPKSASELLKSLQKGPKSASELLTSLHEKHKSASELLKSSHEKHKSASKLLTSSHEKHKSASELLKSSHEKHKSASKLLTSSHEKHKSKSASELLTSSQEKHKSASELLPVPIIIETERPKSSPETEILRSIVPIITNSVSNLPQEDPKSAPEHFKSMSKAPKSATELRISSIQSSKTTLNLLRSRKQGIIQARKPNILRSKLEPEKPPIRKYLIIVTPKNSSEPPDNSEAETAPVRDHWVCWSCGFLFDTRDQRNNHKPDCYFKCPFPECEISKDLPYNKLKLDSKDLELHINTSHFKLDRLRCVDCMKSWKAEADKEIGILTDELKAHYNCHKSNEQINQKYKCIIDDCNTMFYNSKDLKHHVVHTHEDPKVVNLCQSCDKVFEHEYLLLEHLKNRHGPEVKLVKCPEPNCEFTCVPGRTGGIKHHALKHINDRPFLCDVCPKTYKRQRCLIQHQKRHHVPNPERKYKCTFSGCNKDYFSQYDLNFHEESIHSSGRSFICDFCSLTYKSKKGLLEHLRTACVKKKKFEKSKDSKNK